VHVTLAQIRVGRDVEANVAGILASLDSAPAGGWVLFPEGAVSGYFPGEDDFLRGDPRHVGEAVDEIRAEARRRGSGLVLGSALHADGAWRNAVIVQDPAGRHWRYDKVELSALDARHFAAGREAPVYNAGEAAIGVQVCRELLFPLAWHDLAVRGARVLMHVNNAIKPIDAVWEHVLIARAVENNVFVCSVNNAAAPQALASCVIAPSGDVLLRTATQTEQIVSCELDLASTRPAY
jgi:predicted amidohydrolase